MRGRFSPKCLIRSVCSAAAIIAASVSAAEPVATIPFRWTPGQIEVEVSVNGRTPVWFIVDTGAEYSIVSHSLAESLQLKTASRDGRDFARDVSLRLGTVELHDEVMVLPLENFKRQGRSIVGLIGYELFNRYAVTIDYNARTLTLHDGRTFRPPPSSVAVAISFADRLAVVPVTLEIDGRSPMKANVIIDTGASEALVLRHPFAESHDLFALANKPSSFTNLEERALTFLKLPLNRLIFAGSSFDDLTASIYGTLAGAGGYTRTDGVLGNEILRRFRVTVDYSRRRIYLAR